MSLNSLHDNIRRYISVEVSSVSLPNQAKTSYVFTDLNRLLDILLKVFDSPISEPRLKSVGAKFYEHLKIIIEADFNTLPQAVEGLATNLEAYLKLIGFYRYGLTVLWNGDASSKGLKETMFANLTAGKIAPQKNCKPIKLPIPLINYTGDRITIFDFIRNDLRNNVHNAVSYQRAEVIQLANIAISGYLLITEDNQLLLKQSVFPEYQYLKRIVGSDKSKGLNSVYVELIGEEINKDIDVLAKSVIDERILIDNLLDYQSLDDFDKISEGELIPEEQIVDNILSIVKKHPRLHLIGEAGSGKSTVLLKVLIDGAIEILNNGDIDKKFPFYIHGGEYRPTKTFAQIISKKIDYDWFCNAIENGKVQLLLDGLNEIPERYKVDAYKEISDLINQNDKNCFVLSERKMFFKNSFGLPVFELKQLDYEQIKTFINRYAKNASESLLRNIDKSKNLLQLSYNPLTLKMLIAVGNRGDFPANRGLLFKSFIDTILNLENLKGSTIDSLLKIDVLANVAWDMRNGDTVSMPVSKFKHLIGSYLPLYTNKVGILDFYKDSISSLILKKSDDDEITFYHETYQEYFAALKLKQKFEIDFNFDLDINNPRFFDTIVMCSELLSNENYTLKFFESIYLGSKSPVHKSINKLNADDVGDNVSLGAKIAFSLKKIYPSIYEVAETYVLNLCKLWKYFYQIDGTEILPIETLFATIGCINSEKIYRYITFDYEWLDLWVNSSDRKSNVFKFTHLDSFDSLSKIMIAEIPDFQPFYDVLKNLSIRFFGSSYVVNNLRKLENRLLNKQSENELLELYERDKDFKIFLQLVRLDIKYLNSYPINLSTSSDNEKVLNTLIRYHIHLDSARMIVLKEIINSGINNNLIYFFARVLIDFGYDDHFFKLSKALFADNPKGYASIVVLLQNYTFVKLPLDIQNFFVSDIPNTICFNYSNLTKSHFKVKGEDADKVLIGRNYSFNDNIIQIKNIAPHYIKGEKCIVVGHTDLLTYVNLLPITGNVECELNGKQVVYEYTHFKLSRKAKKIFFILKEQQEKYEINAHKSLYKVSINGIFDWKFFGVDYHFIEDTSEFNIKYDIVEISQIESNSPTSGIMILQGIPVNLLKPQIYHPEIIKTNKHILRLFERDFAENNVEAFVSSLGLKYLFINQLSNFQFGVVYESLERTVNIYDVRSNKIRQFNKRLGNVLEFKVNDLIFIEDNFFLHKLEDISLIAGSINFSIGQVVKVNHEKQEGFISDSSNHLKEDFYFKYAFSDYIPKINDKVNFLPAINPARNLNRPMAVRISYLKI
ncbi:NACHT domain-containing protein [Mucilaginibacter aquariorum]|uniref:NACHT domain-containing protein n=1 Tax=Mucilaginibacter aquariorum TaxID=2967225 RepID=A0ABT1T083_9SPHI|nr:NACHT domain-containing protein [Mucilaginibacter aquariorum]MCQ6957726.1 hypothetical protein [Mucilaginibacter aquariorum]